MKHNKILCPNIELVPDVIRTSCFGAIHKHLSLADTDHTGKLFLCSRFFDFLPHLSQDILNSHLYPLQNRPEDRKTSMHFDFKNFIHNYEPSGEFIRYYIIWSKTFMADSLTLRSSP